MEKDQKAQAREHKDEGVRQVIVDPTQAYTYAGKGYGSNRDESCEHKESLVIKPAKKNSPKIVHKPKIPSTSSP